MPLHFPGLIKERNTGIQSTNQLIDTLERRPQHSLVPSPHLQGYHTPNVTPRCPTSFRDFLLWLCGRPNLWSELSLVMELGMHIVISPVNSLTLT